MTGLLLNRKAGADLARKAGCTGAIGTVIVVTLCARSDHQTKKDTKKETEIFDIFHNSPQRFFDFNLLS
jgi:hypothetical protein